MDRKEAIEVLRKYSPKDAELREALQTLIPELKESEDEIIRKALVELVRKHCVNETRCMMERWLEMQGGYIKFLQSIQVGDEVTRNPDGVLVNLSQLNRVAKNGDNN